MRATWLILCNAERGLGPSRPSGAVAPVRQPDGTFVRLSAAAAPRTGQWCCSAAPCRLLKAAVVRCCNDQPVSSRVSRCGDPRPVTVPHLEGTVHDRSSWLRATGPLRGRHRIVPGPGRLRQQLALQRGQQDHELGTGAPAQTKDAALAAKLPPKVKSAGTIVIGTDASYAPSEFLAATCKPSRGGRRPVHRRRSRTSA